MDKGDLEVGEVELIQETVQSLLNSVENEDNKGDLELGNIDITQKHVQRLLYRVKEHEDSHTNHFLPSIYMLPRTLRDISPSSFNPQVVSIGPLHREDENVQAFEKQKITYMIKLMRRSESPLEEVLNSCMHKAYNSMNKIKSCYVWTKTYGDAEIAEMMVMDACFILEFIYRHKPNYDYTSLIGTAVYDLLLLENQIPFFFLNQIYECTISKNDPGVSLLSYICNLLNRVSIFSRNISINHISINTTLHILSLLHECYKPPSGIVSKYVSPSRNYSAADLHRAGVNFKPNQNPTWVMMMEVKLNRFPCLCGYWSKATLTVPVLDLDDSTELVLRNLIAYEQSSETSNHITAYAYAMDSLVDTQEDISRLVDSSVIINYMGSNEEAANMINGICKQTVNNCYLYDEQFETLYKYSNGYWPKNIAWLKRTYFNSPWNIIALLAGIILFALTMVQTIFSVK